MDGDRVVVVGGSSGIGRATAALLARRGARVTSVGRSAAKLAACAAQDGVDTAQVDVADPTALGAWADRLAAVDHLVVTVSGGRGAGPFASLDLEEVRGGLEAKTLLYLRVVQAVLPALTPTASVTLVTAASARSALPGTVGLAAINGALEAAIAPLAAELAPRRVNAVSPGVVDTPWWSDRSEDDRRAVFESAAARLPLGRVGHPAEIAETVAGLVASTFVTGHVLVADGGGHLARPITL